ncbi:class I SAM-dependent methyltransferase [Candidatus Leptofilum sp.]|uniref:class I SAM-dependent methyltransferase n=1 Tax=Candidatus Leptofilum sp. TaxID=3241576 RepID=UPI003B5A1CEF
MKSKAFHQKSTVAQIRQRFDADVERFSNLQTGQSSTVDAPLAMELITSAATVTNPQATHFLDVGCGAGNYSLKLLEKLPNLDVTLIDLSLPMLDRARERVQAVTNGRIHTHQSDIRELELGEGQFDIIMAAAVLHHLREEAEWTAVFQKFHRALKPGGSIWISDLVTHTTEAIEQMMVERYGRYLTELKDEAYRDHVFAYIAAEDSPRPLLFQIDLLRQVGFIQAEILHKNSVFAAFGAVKPR